MAATASHFCGPSQSCSTWFWSPVSDTISSSGVCFLRNSCMKPCTPSSPPPCVCFSPLWIRNARLGLEYKARSRTKAKLRYKWCSWSFRHQKEGNSTAVKEVNVQSLHGDLACSTDLFPCTSLNYCFFNIFWEVIDNVRITYGETCGCTYDNPSYSLCSFLPKALPIKESVILFVFCHFCS